MSDMNSFNHSNKTDDDNDENHWYHPRTSSPHSSLSVNNSFTQQSSPATMGSWGFDVNRSTNGQTPLSFTLNNNNNNDQQIITRTRKDYNERLVDIPSSSQNFKLRTPTLTRHRNGDEFAAVDRLLRGPNRVSNDSLQQQQQMPLNNQQKTQTGQELLAWQNRMLQRDRRIDNQSPKLTSKGNGFNSFHSSSRQISSINRRIAGTLSTNENQYSEHDHHESTIKSARIIKRYIELVYHLQSFYERITDQLFNENSLLKTNQSLFTNHCRRIAQQLQNSKPIWEEKLADLQNLLKDISSFQWLTIKSETTFLQRRSTLINLIQILKKEKDLDDTDLSIRNDIDRILYEDKLAIQLQDELSTLLQHQSLLNDFTSLLQWNRLVYSSNEQSRVENVLPLLREQISTTDNYILHVSQQLTEMVTSLRSLEKYILSYTNTIPLMDDGIVPSQRTPSTHGHWRPYDETDIDSMKTRESRLQQSHRNGNTNHDSTKIRPTSMPRHIDPEELNHNSDRDDLRISTKKNSIDLNTNNSNNNGITTRFAAVKSAKRDNKIPSNSILKSCSHPRSSNERNKDFDIDTEIFRPSKVDIPDRFIDFDNDEQMLTTNERIEKMKKKEDVRKMLSKQNMHETNDHDLSDDDVRVSFSRRGVNKERVKALNLQSILAEEAKEKSRQVAAKHNMNKSYQQQLTYPNA